MKPTAAVFSFASCEGCSLMILECENELLDILGKIEFVNFREAMDKISDDYDIAFIDGSVTTEHGVEELKEIREHAGLLVALGACATHGCVNTLKNFKPLPHVQRIVYGENTPSPDTIATHPIEDFVKVDYKLYGCPIDRTEFLSLVTSLLTGQSWAPVDYPVCVECKAAGVVCLFNRGQTCLGPVARAGCGAICTRFGNRCEACRGLMTEPNLSSLLELAHDHGLSAEELTDQLRMYGARSEVVEA